MIVTPPFFQCCGRGAIDGPNGDPDVAAFIAAAGITDATQKTAINQLVTDCKTANIWTKFYALYPFVGGAATPHSFNLKNPAQYQITFDVGITHNANGITGDGVSAACNTHLLGDNVAFIDNLAFGFYNRTAGVEAVVTMGNSDGTNEFGIYAQYVDTNSYFDNCAGARVSHIPSGGEEQGLAISSRTSGILHTAYQKGNSVGTSASAQGTLPVATNIWILSDNGTVGSARNLALAFVSLGLTGANVTAFNTAVQTYQTTLSRQV